MNTFPSLIKHSLRASFLFCLYYTKFRLGKFGIDSKFTQYVTKFAFGYFCQTLPTSQDKVETKHQNINTYDIHDSGKSIYIIAK